MQVVHKSSVKRPVNRRLRCCSYNVYLDCVQIQRRFIQMSAPESACGLLVKGCRIEGKMMKAIGWAIEMNHFKGKQIGECLTSPVFDALDRKCQMKVFPRGVDEECEDYASFFLQPLNRSIDIKEEFMLFLDTKINESSTSCEYDIINSIDRGTGKMYGSKKFLKYDTLLQNVSESSAATTTFGFGVFTDNNNLYQPLNFSDVLTNQRYSDVKFIVENKPIPAHKVILANKSKVFAAMFEHKMKENLEGVVEIKDIEFDVILALFRYIYSGIIEDIGKMAKSLLIAADKYEVTDLKAICVEYLEYHLIVENVRECLDIAERHNVDSLKLKTVDFIKSNLNEISNTPELKLIMESHPDIMVEVIRELSKKVVISTS